MRILVVILVVAAFVGVVKLLPWWITVGLVVLAFLLRGRIVQAVIGGAARGLFDAKSRVLRGATVQVHGVKKADPPPSEPTPAEEPPPRPMRHYTVDATLTPDPKAKGPMEYWDPFEVELADYAAKPRTMDDDEEEDATLEITVHDVKLLVSGAPQEIEDKLQGPARLEFHVAVPAGLGRAKFRYYFEEFGEVSFPDL